MTLMTSRRAAFWCCQLGGWTAYGMDRYLSEKRFFPVYFIYLCVAFGLTLVVLRPLYRRVYARRPTPVVLLCAGVCASHRLTMRSGPPIFVSRRHAAQFRRRRH